MSLHSTIRELWLKHLGLSKTLEGLIHDFMILKCVEFVFWLCVFVIHCKYPICHHLIDVHLYKYFTCLGITKTCLNQNYYIILLQVIRLLYLVACPIISVVGVVGNSLSAVVMNRPSMRSSSIAVFITGLAITDSITLILDFSINWMPKATGIMIVDIFQPVCSLFKWVMLSTTFYGHHIHALNI